MANTSPDIAGQGEAAGRWEIRVAWLFPSLARGYYWQPFFKEFAAHCPQTAVFTSVWPGFAPGYKGTFEVHTLPGLRYIDLKMQVQDSRRGFMWTPPSILRKLAAFDPDVIFSAGFSGWTLCALLFKLFRRSRAVIYWEGCSAQSVGASKTKALFRSWIARFADAGVSNSDEGASYLHDVIGMPQEKLLCHPCQVPDLFLLGSDPAEASLLTLKQPVFLYVGSISPRKGWNYLLDASRLLLSQGVRDFSVVFAGAGEQEQELRAAVRNYPLSDIVHHIGAVPYHKLGSYYRGADVFVSPTRADTWGVAVLEAMAFGKPVLCSKYAGTRQMVVPGENGFIFDPFKPMELAGCMAKFIQDQSLAQRLGSRSREKMAPYTPERAAKLLANLAMQTVENQRARLSHDAASAAVHKVKT
jgi:glycosyltransferase involved in cell wall biosynthesis